MSVDGIRKGIAQARVGDGKVDAKEVDQPGFMHITSQTGEAPVKVLLDSVVSRQLEERRKSQVPKS